MPNGGSDNCAYCGHFDSDQHRCILRGVQITISHWTTCANHSYRAHSQEPNEPKGPLYAIVGEVRQGAGGYTRIPYFDGCRVDTSQPPGGGDTVVRFVDSTGHRHEFPTAADYLAFYRKAGRSL